MPNFDETMKRINRQLGQLIKLAERDVAKQFASLLANIRNVLAKNYDKYEKGGTLTLQEMLKHDRLTKMNKEINHHVKTHYKGIFGIIKKVVETVYMDGYHLTAWATETHTKSKLDYSAVRPETLQAMLDNPVTGLTLNERLERNRAEITYRIQEQTTQGLLNNESYSTMQKRLKGVLENDTVKATRIVRTEGHRVQESAKHDAAAHATKHGVIMGKQWNTLQDERVRNGKVGKSNHKKLDNQQLPMDGLFDDGLAKGLAPGQLGHASSDINCRCFLTYTILKVEKPDHQELENMMFEQWEKERLRVQK